MRDNEHKDQSYIDHPAFNLPTASTSGRIFLSREPQDSWSTKVPITMMENQQLRRRTGHKLVILLVTLSCLTREIAVGARDGSPPRGRERHRRGGRRRRLVEETFADEGDDDLLRVFVGYTSGEGRKRVEEALLGDETEGGSATATAIDRRRDFDSIGAVAVQLTKSKLKELEQDSNIKYIERDEIVYALNFDWGGETVPYGISLSDAIDGIPSGFGTASSSGGNCSDPNTFKVAIG